MQEMNVVVYIDLSDKEPHRPVVLGNLDGLMVNMSALESKELWVQILFCRIYIYFPICNSHDIYVYMYTYIGAYVQV